MGIQRNMYNRQDRQNNVAFIWNLTGFSLNKAEQRCGICGALGHLGCLAASSVKP